MSTVARAASWPLTVRCLDGSIGRQIDDKEFPTFFFGDLIIYFPVISTMTIPAGLPDCSRRIDSACVCIC